MDRGDAMVNDMILEPSPPRPDIYHVEYNHLKTRAKLPDIFASKFIQSVPTNVLLTDPIGNQSTVSITTEVNDVYFTQGWNEFGIFYGLYHGAWITMYYTSLGNFKIEITTHKGDKLTYPSIAEPLPTNDYANPIILDDEDDDIEETEPMPHIVDRSKFITAVKKWLSYEEITGPTLEFSENWCKYSLPKNDGHVSLVDEYGKVWPCYYKAKIGDGDTAGIVRGWHTFSVQKKLFQGQGVKFGVISPNSNVLYFTPAA